MIGEEDMGLEVYAEWVGGIVRGKTGTLSAKSELILARACERKLTSCENRSIADALLEPPHRPLRSHRPHHLPASTRRREVLRTGEDARRGTEAPERVGPTGPSRHSELGGGAEDQEEARDDERIHVSEIGRAHV